MSRSVLEAIALYCRASGIGFIPIGVLRDLSIEARNRVTLMSQIDAKRTLMKDS